MNVTTSAEHWCDQCHEYLSIDRPAVSLLAGNWLARICVVCLRSAVEACESATSLSPSIARNWTAGGIGSEIAASHGYVNAAELLAAIADGEVAVVLLDDKQRDAVIPWLITRAAPLALDEALFEIAAALDEARHRKARMEDVP